MQLTWVISNECPLLNVELFDSSECCCKSLSDLWDFTEDIEGNLSISRVSDSIVLTGLTNSVGIGKVALEADF